MIGFYSCGFYDCDACGNMTKDVFELSLVREPSKKGSEFFFLMCPDCRRKLINDLIKITPNVQPLEPNGGKWFEIWKEDKESILSTMYKNLSSDLDAGYSYRGSAVQTQLKDIEEFRKGIDDALDRFKTMTDGEVSRWCYYDLKKRGAIE